MLEEGDQKFSDRKRIEMLNRNKCTLQTYLFRHFCSSAMLNLFNWVPKELCINKPNKDMLRLNFINVCHRWM